ncbi:MAG: non-ribosomal peptide synthetase, partial [Alphaproteobacteria bacterium]|nr:non-ribosomal peptide synthetase [Alphaproteobacteria bacterium]
SLSFDFTVTSLFGALTEGKTLRIYDSKEDLSSQLREIVLNPESGWIKLTPAHINLIDDQSLQSARSKVFVLGGEALTEEQIKHLRKNAGCRIYNEYGPTEATVGCIVKDITEDNIPHIGRPIPNSEVYLTDSTHQLVPYGSIGEICIGGVGLARGYLNRPELTKEKFITNPYNPTERLYRTGDLGRWREDGNLEYLGRMDDQVKIRGYRIELGEIEQAISSHKASGQVVVIARAINNATDKELIAYMTGEAPAEELKSYLKERLPSYMVPNYYVHLESIPLTSNGKVDRKSLPDPNGTGLKQGEYVAPITETEKKLVKIWSEVLGVEEDTLSIKADFFDLGGHSIKAIRLLGQVHKQLGVKLALKELFASPTIEQLNKIISTSTEKGAYASIQTIKESDEYAVSSSQRRLWVLSRFEGANEAYNIPQVLRLEGSLNEQFFIKAYQALLTRHEILRTIFTEDLEGNPRQRVLSITDERFKIRIGDYSKELQDTREESIKQYVSEEISRGFSLEEGPLIRCSLLKEKENSYVWVLVMHHIVSDGWSMGVLHREWSELYNSELENRSANLQPLSIQYKDYAAWHNAQLQSEDITTHKNYWLEQFKGDLPVLELPSDKPRPKVMTYNGASVYRELDKQTTDKLKTFSQQQGGTMFMTLQTALNILLHKYTGQEDIVIGSPIAGREHPDLEGQIGFYVNTLALRNQFRKEDTVTELYQKIRKNTLSAYSHQVYPYDELVDALNLTRDMSRNPLFDVMLIFQSREEGENKLAFSKASIRPYLTEESHYEVAKFDMSFGFEEYSEGMYYSLNYNKDIYSEEQVKRMLSHLEQLLETISTQTQTTITAYGILTQEDKIYLLETLNDTKSDYPKDKTIVDLFEEQVKLTPENIAVKFKDTEITYRELNEKSNQLAHYL